MKSLPPTGEVSNHREVDRGCLNGLTDDVLTPVWHFQHAHRVGSLGKAYRLVACDENYIGG